MGELFMIADHRLWHSNISFSKASTSNIESLKFCIWAFMGEENKQIFPKLGLGDYVKMNSTLF